MTGQDNLNKDNITIKTKNIYIIGTIDEDMSNNIIETLFETNWKDEGFTNLNVYICSEGGYLTDCFAIIDAIQFIRDCFKIHVNTLGLGKCASAGFFLFLLGDVRELFPNCNIYVHEHLATLGESSYDETKKELVNQKISYNTYVEYTTKRLGISKARVKTLLKKNRFLTQNELIKYNIINSSI